MVRELKTLVNVVNTCVAFLDKVPFLVLKVI